MPVMTLVNPSLIRRLVASGPRRPTGGSRRGSPASSPASTCCGSTAPRGRGWRRSSGPPAANSPFRLALFQLRQELRVDFARAIDRHGTGGHEAHLGDEGEEVGDAVVDVDLAFRVEVPVLEQGEVDLPAGRRYPEERPGVGAR